jgi:type VI protein secretion system component Hcp
MRLTSRFGLLLAFAWLFCGVPRLTAQVTAFTYQGRLSDGGAAASGSYDLQFTLYDAVVNGNVVAGPLVNSPTIVSAGVFSVSLDFGLSAFPGDPRWLEIGVRPAGSANPYTVLAPRQQIQPTPYALRSVVASTANALSVVCANCVTTANIADGAVTAGKIAPQQVVKSIAGLTDNVGLTAGAGISITTSNNSLTIASIPIVPPVLTHLRLNIPGITGDNADGTIEAYSYYSSVTSPDLSPGVQVVRPSFSRLIVQKGLDHASAILQTDAAQHQYLNLVELWVYAVDPVTQAETLTYKVRLGQVLVAQMNPVLSIPSSVREEVDFDYDTIEWDYLTGGVVVASRCFQQSQLRVACPPSQ